MPTNTVFCELRGVIYLRVERQLICRINAACCLFSIRCRSFAKSLAKLFHSVISFFSSFVAWTKIKSSKAITKNILNILHPTISIYFVHFFPALSWSGKIRAKPVQKCGGNCFFDDSACTGRRCKKRFNLNNGSYRSDSPNKDSRLQGSRKK